MHRQVITIDPNNPYMQDWWDRMEAVDNGRPSAIRDIVMHDDGDAYLEWHRQRIGNGQEHAKLLSVRAMIKEMRSGVFDATTPILFRFGAHGDLWIQDGNHRASILVSLGLPVTGEVEMINKAFQPVADLDSIYHPHPHPLLQGKTCWRTDMTRYKVVAKMLSGESVYELGCAEGVGLWEMQQLGASVVGGCEADSRRRVLASGLTGLRIDNAGSNTSKPRAEVLLALSVLHHLPANLADAERWVDYCSRYIAVCVEVPKNNQGCHPKWMTDLPNRESFWLDKFDVAFPNKQLIVANDPHGKRDTWMYYRG